MIKLILCDDHQLVRAGLRRVLEDRSDMQVVGEAASGEDLLQLLRDIVPDVILMDVKMPGIGGLEATRRVLQRYPEVRIIAVSMYMEEPYPTRLLTAGARGYISKDAAAEEVVAAIQRVAAGGVYVESSVASTLAQNLIQGTQPEKSPFERLSDREMQVMLMITQGQNNQAISDSLHLSPKTVSTYRYRLFDKLGVSNDVGLTRMAMRYGLLEETEGDTS